MNHLPSYLSLQYTKDIIHTLQEEVGLVPDELSKAKELTGANLPPLVRPEVLSFLFGVSHGFIVSISRNPEHYYRVYSVPKRGGGTRRIEAPRRFIKLIQRWIYYNILRYRELPPTVTGFVKGQNIFTNVLPHTRFKNLMVVDIKDFFPSVTSKEVYKIFKSFGFPRKVCNLLTGLCTFESRLPQGAPTSPALANLAFYSTDLALNDLSKGWECVYTRYADDIAFSGDILFSTHDMGEVAKLLKQSGFMINRRKSRIIGSGGRKLLTGLVVNKSGLPQRYKRRQWRAMFHQASLEPTKYVGQASHLKGLASFVNEYNPKLAAKYFLIANKVSELENNNISDKQL